MYILFNNEMENDYVGELADILRKDPKVSFLYQPFSVGHGEAIRQLLQISMGEYLMLLEDDGFIFTPGVVDKYFRKIEEGHSDIIGSPRRSCSQEIWDRSQEVYNLDYSGVGDKGPNFWPNFFFCKREHLLKTDQNFGSTVFKAGEYNDQLSYRFVEDNAGDTFVWASIQLRAMGLRIEEIQQHHSSPTELKDRDMRWNNWQNGRPTYIHAGSLSSGWSHNGFLRLNQPVIDKQDVETRVAFWKLAVTHAEGLEQFKPAYWKGIDDLVRAGELNEREIQSKYNLYLDLIRP
jgi:glycosyltransferase involved in cell wall biosynthesis